MSDQQSTPARGRLRGMRVLAVLAIVMAGSGVAVAWVGNGTGDEGAAITTDRWDTAPGGRPLSDDDTVALVEASLVAARQGAEIPAEVRPSMPELDRLADLGSCDYQDDPPWTLCTRGDRDADRSIVLLGNSHGRHWIPAVEKVAKDEGYRTHHLTKSACTPARVQSISRNSETPWEVCTEFNAWTQTQIEEIEPDVVMISGSAPRGVFVDGELTKDADEMREEMGRGFRALVEDVTPYAGTVAVVGDVPRREAEGSRRGDQPGECLGMADATLRGCLVSPHERAAAITEASREATEGTEARFVDTEPWFCADGRCPAVVGDMIPMRDQGHVSIVYAEHLAEPLGRALGMIGTR